MTDDTSLNEKLTEANKDLEPGEMIVFESRIEDGELRIDIRTAEEPTVQADE